MSRAKDIMTEEPVMLPVTSTLSEAVQILQSLDIRHLPVVDDQLELVGMLSDRDLRALAVPRIVGDEWLGELRTALEAPVSSIMSADVFSVDEETETSEIIELMLEQRVGALPVLNADGFLVGIVSYVDVLRELRDLENAATG